MIQFAGRVVLVTGASRGIGAATALRFAGAGARGIVVHYHTRQEEARVVADEIEQAGGESMVWGADLADAAAVETLFSKSLARFGGIDVVVANAGIWPSEPCPLDQVSPERWAQTLRVNLDGMYYVCREAGKILREDGALVTVSSTAGQRGEAGHADYAASKGGVISLTKSLAVELAPRGIRVNCVAPGWVDTEMSASALQADLAARQSVLRTIPLGRIASPEDVAGPILFLASSLARHITGEVLNINGGSVLCG
ncbi:MAG: SDR family NAD(P)-dependent oxidoreductase [Blastocatellia bacterium]